MNRRRNLLHKDKLSAFIEWAKQRSYLPHPLAHHAYEVARLQHEEGGPYIVIYTRERGEHLTTTGVGTSLVERFLKENNKQARRIRAAGEAW